MFDDFQALRDLSIHLMEGGFTEEREHVDRYVQELQSGRYVVSVHLSGGVGQLSRLCELFKASGGHFMHHYTPYPVEELSA